jgi:predicted DNA-binding transcriptional regulator YafY
MKNDDKRRKPAEGKFIKTPSIQSERASAGYSRPPLARMMRLHEWLTANRYPNCRKMAEEFEVAPKTIQRDINFMRDQMGLPIEYDKPRFGFRYTRPVTGFPTAGAAPDKPDAAPWKHSAPPGIGEKPALSSTARGGIPVRIRFSPESSRTVRRRVWHATQVIHPLPGGGLDMTLRVRDEAGIARWVLSWGAQAWVIDPPRIRNLVHEIAREILARH